MALVDVTELLSDPDFVDPVRIFHRTATVNTKGENELTELYVDTIGSVQPTSGRDLQRLPEALRIQDVKTFWIKGEIKSDGNSAYPDILVWQCNRYAVQMVLEWTNFGQGWCQALCVREKPSV